MKQEDYISKFRKIGKQLGYTSEWRPSFLFKKLEKSTYSMEEKVGFVFYCYGWNGYKRTISNTSDQVKDYNAPIIFSSGKRFIEQFDNLIFPCKNRSSKSGSHVWVKFMCKPVITAGMSAHFNEQVVPVGVERCFDGYEDDNIENCWEDITISSDNLDFDEISLYLGESGKVYWFCYDGDSLGIAADSLLEFFSVRFSLAEDKHLHDVPTRWTSEDLAVMRDYRKDH
jgi:hypothetical protein